MTPRFLRQNRKPASRAARFVLLLAAVVASTSTSCKSNPASELSTSKAILLARDKHQDYGKATFSFEKNAQDVPALGNDWDIEFGNGGDTFGVTMSTEDRSRILDLGWLQWSDVSLEELPDLPAYPEPQREPLLTAYQGHIYLVHTADQNSDLLALFRVERLWPGDKAEISWLVVGGRL